MSNKKNRNRKRKHGANGSQGDSEGVLLQMLSLVSDTLAALLVNREERTFGDEELGRIASEKERGFRLWMENSQGRTTVYFASVDDVRNRPAPAGVVPEERFMVPATMEELARIREMIE